ncbi:hypothetical protein F2Q70_00014520, partial [Brassica cretica]
MIRTLTESLNNGNEATAQEALELFIELAGTEPRFLRRQLVDIVASMLQIAEAESLEESTRHLAVEFLVTLAEARERAPGMVRKLPQFIDRLFAALMKMLGDIEDDPAWYSAETEDEDAGETGNYSMGQECLDRLAIALGGNTIVPVAYQQFSAYLVASEWQKHHASLIALAQIAEGCSKVMIKNLEQVVSMILSQFQSPHPRVRWAAINAIGQLSTDLGPDLQNQHHQRVLPALAAAMDDIQNPRVQAHAASAVLNFSENCTPEILAPYLDGIVSKLLVLLQNGKQMVQEGALTALASVADSSQEHFQKYYDVVMPYLKTILMNATDKSKRMLRAKSMECISLVGMAVGKDRFKQDAIQVWIAEAESLEESTRHLAVEFLVTLAEARERAPGMVRKLPQFIDRLFAALMKMLEDIEDDPAWYSAETEDEDAGETSNYSMGQECLDRLAIALGGNTIVPVAYQQFYAYLVASAWQKHHASLIALAQIAEGCSKVMIKNLEQVVSMILSQVQSPHPRVRWAAINAIGQLSTDLGPDLQNQHHQRVLPALAAAMDDIQNPRVQAHAASAVLNFSENCTPEILAPYLDGIVSKLLVLLQNGKQMVQEGALTALASVADSSQEHFQKYYDVVMPYLKTILMNATDKSKRMLRAKSMECISLVGMAVGKDRFKQDAIQ